MEKFKDLFSFTNRSQSLISRHPGPRAERKLPLYIRQVPQSDRTHLSVCPALRPSWGGLSSCTNISLLKIISPYLCLVQSRKQKRDKSRLFQVYRGENFFYKIESSSYSLLILQNCVCAKNTKLTHLFTLPPAWLLWMLSL